MSERPFYFEETHGIRITVRPVYLDEQSRPELQQYIFAYYVRIENVSRRTMKLLHRHWYIYDSIGEQHEVRGEGVVGEQPELSPGGVHEYNSFCVLKSPQGYMEGTYTFIGKDDIMMDAEIPRFELLASGYY